jgi:methanogenic corrinoid protein MtbC1
MQSYIDESTDIGRLTQQYLDLLLGGARREASQLILGEVANGTPIPRIYLEVFQVSQYEIGRLWEHNRITVAHEHFCTAATQMIMSQLYPHILASERCDRTLVATCVSDDLHELGIRMVSDLFEMAGWDTYYLGANTPASAVIASLLERGADVLAASTTMPAHVAHVKHLIDAVRADPECGGVTILVGGQPFIDDPQLWRELGADGHAGDAASAVETGNALIDAR